MIASIDLSVDLRSYRTILCIPYKTIVGVVDCTNLSNPCKCSRRRVIEHVVVIVKYGITCALRRPKRRPALCSSTRIVALVIVGVSV